MAMSVAHDWSEAYILARSGRLAEYVLRIPRTEWNATDTLRYSLLYYASFDDGNLDTARRLVVNGCSFTSSSQFGETPLRLAFLCAPKILEFYLSLGAELHNPLGKTFGGYFRTESLMQSARILIANGYRITDTGNDGLRSLLPFQQAVLKCRTATCAMIWAKKKTCSAQWDKFLLREIAYQVWATRYDTKWKE